MNLDLLVYGVEYGDWGHRNILCAPKVPPGLPGLPSPLCNHVYGFRLIDFEDAAISDSDRDWARNFHAEAIDEMIEDMKADARYADQLAGL